MASQHRGNQIRFGLFHRAGVCQKTGPGQSQKPF